MWPFSLLTEGAQVALLAAACGLFGALVGYTLKWWLDRRESDRQRRLHTEELVRQFEESKKAEREKNKLVRTASTEQVMEISEGKFAPVPDWSSSPATRKPAKIKYPCVVFFILLFLNIIIIALLLQLLR
jgi:hypothetical protein